MHCRLGSATLLQLAFPGEGNLNFPWEKFHWDNTVVKKKEEERKALIRSAAGKGGGRSAETKITTKAGLAETRKQRLILLFSDA